MNQQEAYDKASKLVMGKHESGALEKLIQEGLDVNAKNEYNRTIAEQAVDGLTNFDALYTLWKAKAIPATDYLKRIFASFDQGQTAKDWYRQEEASTEDTTPLDLSANFSVDQLVLKTIDVEFTPEIEGEQDAEIEVNILFEPFHFEGHTTTPELQFIGFSSPSLEQAVFSDGYHFSEADDLEGSSIYLEHAHNPIDLKYLKIEKTEKGARIEVTLFFDFEYERTSFKNQTLTIEFYQAN